MFAIFRSWPFVWLMMQLVALAAQPAGLRIANALDHGSGPLRVELDSSPWNEEGMERAEVSGLRRLQPGVHRLKFSKEGLTTAHVRMTLKAGEIITLVPYASGSEGEVVIRVLKLHGRKADANRLGTLVYVGADERILLELKQLGGSWTPLALRRLELIPFSIQQSRGYLPMRVGRQSLNAMPVMEKGHHVVVIYDLKNGCPASLSYRDRAWPGVSQP